jgi:hypothetical protein
MMLRKLGGYGAATAATPYLLIKVAWIFGILLPDARMGEPARRAINATTALLALVGVLLGWRSAGPEASGCPPGWWCCRSGWAPACWCRWCCWPGAGAGGSGRRSGGRRFAFWGYAKARWPEALAGPLDGGDAPGTPARCGCRWPAWSRWAASCSAAPSCIRRWGAPSGSTPAGWTTATSGGTP